MCDSIAYICFMISAKTIWHVTRANFTYWTNFAETKKKKKKLRNNYDIVRKQCLPSKKNHIYLKKNGTKSKCKKLKWKVVGSLKKENWIFRLSRTIWKCPKNFGIRTFIFWIHRFYLLFPLFFNFKLWLYIPVYRIYFIHFPKSSFYVGLYKCTQVAFQSLFLYF